MSAYEIERLNAALTGRYEVQDELGEGGMATVYLAQDLRHHRSVALKVLKPELAAVVGGERFLTEIETTAGLQHPHILPLYDSGEVDSILFYVMPYVEGETLRDRLDREKQLPVDEAVRIVVAVAGALDYAHRHGVVHRDIKPGNILMQDDQPVVGDFGIALAVGSAGGTRLTETGLSVGTPYYMSPEQATGDQDIGPASDLYSLGAVLYELLTGEPPYGGKTAQAVLGRIIQGAPVSATALRKTVPLNVDEAVRKALETLPADRFHSAQDFAHALTDPSFRHAGGVEGTARAASAGPWRWVSLALATSTVVLAIWLGHVLQRPEPPRPVERFAQPFLPDQQLDFLGAAGFGLSPDGTMLVYRLVRGSEQILVQRRWDELSASPVRETKDASWPTISPDGTELAFRQGGAIKAMSLAGGPVRTLIESGAAPFWGSDGYVYAASDSGAVRVPDAGGTVELVSRLEKGEGGRAVRDVLPGGKKALLEAAIPPDTSRIFGLDLRSGTTTPIVDGTAARYLASGYLLYGVRQDSAVTLMAARFDPDKMVILGTPVAVMDGLSAWSLSDDGTLFYTTGGGVGGALASRPTQLYWVTRDGKATPVDRSWTFALGSSDVQWRLSPDGTMLANRERTADGLHIWIKHLPDGPLTRLTFGKAEDRMPDWIPGTRDVSFISARGGGLDLWKKPANGTSDAQLVFDFERDIATYAWSPDGKWLILRTAGPRGRVGDRDLYVVRPGVDSVAQPLLADSTYDEMYPDVSPDGKWLAYQTTETGRNEIYVRPFPDVTAGRWQVSVDGGRQPRWAHSGKEIFFQGPKSEMMVAAVDTRSGSFHSGTPKLLFEAEPDWLTEDITGTIYEVARDDQRFLIDGAPVTGQVDTTSAAPRAVLVENFEELLKQQVSR